LGLRHIHARRDGSLTSRVAGLSFDLGQRLEDEARVKMIDPN
jgi:hypothetical protein